MARLTILSAGVEERVVDLKLGVNRIGRSPDNDVAINHPTVSGFHCELSLVEQGVIIQDLESTNGTFVNGKRTRSAQLMAGQHVRLGDVELRVENTDVTIAIPKFINLDLPAPPVVMSDGAMECPRHPGARASHRCTHCLEVMCDVCVHHLNLKGKTTILLLCPVCSHGVEPIDGVPRPKKKSFFKRVGETLKMKLTRAIGLSPRR